MINSKKAGFIILGFLFISTVLAWSVIFDLSKNGVLQVNFFDVGQGDSIFIETPKGQQILIDGGPDSQVLQRLAKEMPFWDRTIDLVILSHPEKDHMAGLLDVLKRYKVENVLWTGVIRDTAEFEPWQKEIFKEGANIKIAQAGQRVTTGTVLKELYIDILYPAENVSGRELKDSNNTSIVSRLVFGQNSFLFTGDIEEAAERALVSSGKNLESNILKVSHHGSKTSTSEEFVGKVSPELAIISLAKDNFYGHPTSEVLNVLGKYGIKILRTDQQGNIKIICDGNNYEIPHF